MIKCKYGHLPKSNVEFWEIKINGNIERDKQNISTLEKHGWNIISQSLLAVH
jgi:DNA mismatch endonuclease (patch repair protein)